MSRATFEMNLKDAAIRLLPKLNEFIESRKTTESFGDHRADRTLGRTNQT